MAPKRKQPVSKAAAASKPASTTTAKRRSKLAKENDISAEEEAEIRDAFALFSKPEENAIATSDVRRCLIALNTPPTDKAEMREMLETVDPEQTGWVGYEHFVAIAALKLRARHDDGDAEAGREEVVRAYGLFTKGASGREITMGDLRRVARELREDVPEAVLRDMVREATGGGLGGVGMEDFEGVMRRAGVFN